MSRSERPTACTTKRPRRSSAPASLRSRPDRGAVTGPRWLTLAVVSAATAMLLLDVTVVNVALPAIQEDLDASFAELQWVVDAYALTLAGTLLTAGAIADRRGRRAVFAAGLAAFTVCSALCAAAGSGAILDLARATRGGGDVRGLAGRPGERVPRPGARVRARRVGRDHRRRAGGRPARRRRARRRARMALGVPGEPAGRRPSRLPHVAFAAGVARPATAGARPPRAADLRRRLLPPHARADPWQRRRLDERAGARLARGGGARPRRLRRRRAPR